MDLMPQQLGKQKKQLSRASILVLILVLISSCISIYLLLRYLEPKVMRRQDTGQPMLNSYLDLLCKDNKGIAFGASSLISTHDWNMLKGLNEKNPDFALVSVNLDYTIMNEFSEQMYPERPYSWELLDSYYQSGNYDFALLLKLYLLRELNWPVEIDDTQSSTILTGGDESQLAEAWQLAAPGVDSRLGQMEAKLLFDMRAIAPGQAIPYYLEAIRCCRLRDYPAAIVWLRKGNIAPQCNYPSGAPLDAMWTAARQGRVLGGDLALLELADMCSCREYSITTELEHATFKLTDYAVSATQPQLLNDLNFAICRIAKAEDSSYYHAGNVLHILCLLENGCYMIYGKQGKSASSSLAFSEYNEKVSLIRSKAPCPPPFCGCHDESLGELIMNALDSFADQLTNGQAANSLWLSSMRQGGKEILRDCIFVKQKIVPQINELQQFDFVSLSWTQTGSAVHTASGS